MLCVPLMLRISLASILGGLPWWCTCSVAVVSLIGSAVKSSRVDINISKRWVQEIYKVLKSGLPPKPFKIIEHICANFAIYLETYDRKLLRMSVVHPLPRMIANSSPAPVPTTTLTSLRLFAPSKEPWCSAAGVQLP